MWVSFLYFSYFSAQLLGMMALRSDKASSVLGDTEAEPKRKMQFLVLSDYITAQWGGSL